MTIASRTVRAGGFIGTSRKPSDIRGFMVHMAEGNNVAAYLSRAPSRGVSVQYVVEADGEIVAMVPELRVAGSLNPAALRTDDGPYFGRSHLDHVLGTTGAGNPNRYVIAIEVAGRAKDGPNARQVTSLVRLFRDCRKRYPNIKPLGHRDQQSVKPCPGGTKAMRAAFAAMGGHGKDYRKPRPVPPPVVPPPVDDTMLVQDLADARARIADLEEQVEAMQAAIAAAIGVLDDFGGDEG